MKPTIKNGVAIITPQGFLDSNNVEAILWFEEIDMILKSDVNALFISLEHIVFFNASAMRNYSDLFTKNIMSKKSIICGFCDYDKKKYELLIKYLGQDTKVTLIETSALAYILYGQETHDAQKILVWNENITQRGVIMYKLIERGCLATMANSREEFESEEKKGSFEYRVENCYFGGSREATQHYTKKHMVVYIFANFLDSENTELFDHMSLKNYIRLGLRVFLLDFTLVTGMNPHAISFLTRLAKANAENEAKFIIVGIDEQKVGANAKDSLKNAGIVFIDSLESAFTDQILIRIANENSEKSSDNKKTLSKATIKALNILVESTISTIESVTKVASKKNSISMAKFDMPDDGQDDFFGASIGFYGNIEGLLLLVFQKNTAYNACSLLVGTEDVKENEVLDSIGELINITMGKTKTTLSNQGLTIKMTLPRTFKSLSEINLAFKDKDGVMMDFSFDDKPFKFFITA